jgi:hypothetical protein
VINFECYIRSLFYSLLRYGESTNRNKKGVLLIVIDSVPVLVIPAGITRTATQTGTDEAASRTGQNSGRYRLSRANPAIPGGIGSLGYSGTVDAEEELRSRLVR